MLRRIGPCRTFLLAALVLGLAACDDESPTLSGTDIFGGNSPTREVILPAGATFRQLGVFTGYSAPSGVVYSVVANRFAGELSANALYRSAGAFPRSVTYTQDNVNRTDTLPRFVSGELVVRVDSALSTAGPVTLQVFRLAQDWDAATATWESARDTGGVRTPWRTPGGTRGELLSQAEYTVSTAGDSVIIPLDSADVAALRDSAGFGFTIGSAEAGSRVQIRSVPTLRTGVRPSNAVRDTVVTTTIPIETQPNTFVFTPEPPQPAGLLAAGGIRSARSLFSFELPDSVTGCNASGASCTRVALRDVQLNRVSLLLRRAPVSAAFAPLDSAIVSVYTITEPELGRRAPLGVPVLDLNERVRFANASGFLSPQSAAVFAPADTLVELNITAYATSAARGDTVPTDFALLGGPLVGIPSLRPNGQIFDTFGLVAFLPEPRLRIVYTLPARSELP
jgi:hypothetical protein